MVGISTKFPSILGYLAIERHNLCISMTALIQSRSLRQRPTLNGGDVKCRISQTLCPNPYIVTIEREIFLKTGIRLLDEIRQNFLDCTILFLQVATNVFYYSLFLSQQPTIIIAIYRRRYNGYPFSPVWV